MAVLRGGHSCLIALAMHVLASFEWSFFWENRGPFWDGFKNTMKAGVVGILLAYVVGLALGAVRAHRIPVLNQVAVTYVELIRNTPILVQIIFLYYGLPVLGIHLETFTVAWLSITIWGGAFMTENFRAGFEAVPARLREAGFALGFTPLKAFLNVTLPIGGRIALPSTISTSISVLKNTLLLLLIGYPELTYVANSIQSNTIRFLEARLALPEAL